MAQLQQLPLYTEHLSLWLSDEQGLVFHHGLKSLFKLEPLSLALFIALDEGNNKQQTLKRIEEYSGLTQQQILPSFLQVSPLFKYQEVERSYKDGVYPELQNHFKQTAINSDFIIQVAQSSFTISCADDTLFKQIKQLLQPIHVCISSLADEEVDFRFEIEQEKDSTFSLYSNDMQVESNLTLTQVMPVFIDRLQILAYQQSDYCFGFHGGALVKKDPDLRQDDDVSGIEKQDPDLRQDDDVSGIEKQEPGLRQDDDVSGIEKQEPGLRQDDDEITHSSHLSRRSFLSRRSREGGNPQYKHTNKTILLPGVSGAGKSTLTAELSVRGYQVYSDEIIALNNQLNLTAINLPMAIKSGRWQLTESLYPEIANQTEWHRTDGRILKYIWPQKCAEQSHQVCAQDIEKDNDRANEEEQLNKEITPHSNTLLLSPNFNANANPKATKLSIIDTLTLVTEGGYQLGVELSHDRVEQLLHFCEQINAYQITYANSEQALILMEELCQQ